MTQQDNTATVLLIIGIILMGLWFLSMLYSSLENEDEEDNDL